PTARFLFVGEGMDAERLKVRAMHMGLCNVEFRARQPLSAMRNILADANALLAHLRDDPLFAITIPSKTQEYLAAGRPILMAVRGDAADLVRRAGAGVFAEPENPDSIACAVKQLALASSVERKQMGRRGREFYQRELSMERAVTDFDLVFRGVAPARTARVRGKRIFDIVAAALALLVCSPILALLATAVRLVLGSPVFFRQLRPGRHGVPFRILKFRTMREGSLPDAERLTRFGRFLRRTSLDELPELWNVLAGDMSLVGPRPLLIEYSDCFSVEERQRFQMRPGITGWAQIHGRNRAPWDERLARDVWYVRNWSFGLDLRILAETVKQAARGEDIVEDPSSLMPDLDEERGRCRVR